MLINVQFKVADNAAAGLVPISFTNTPPFREVAGSPAAAGGAQALATTFTNDNLIITGPTAAEVSVSGRLITTEDRGIKNVIVSITDSKGIERTTTTTSFGYYSFDDVTAGETYIITVSGKPRSLHWYYTIFLQNEVTHIILPAFMSANDISVTNLSEPLSMPI